MRGRRACSLANYQREGRAVLVTGCSSGIGRAMALHLADHRFIVFATVRKEKDAKALSQVSPNLVPICPLDLIAPTQVAAAARKVLELVHERGLRGLYAIVNNAGGGSIPPLELLRPEALRQELETRIVGLLALMQALLSSLRAAQGRIIWIITPALIPVPFVGSIHVADFAVNCLARTLPLELRPWRIPVVLVRREGRNTAAVKRTAQTLRRDLQEWPPERSHLYAQRLRQELAELAAFERKRSDPEVVASGGVQGAGRAPLPLALHGSLHGADGPARRSRSGEGVARIRAGVKVRPSVGGQFRRR
ncbi:MAG: SDR family NAD(P)-dependent oxidoreductase [Candidatus Oleimicrobiaceae bacterium]